jgi:hypothetical protein
MASASLHADELFRLEPGMFWEYEVKKEASDSFAKVKNKVLGSHRFEGLVLFQIEEFGSIYWIRNSRKGQMEAVNLYGKKVEDIIGISEKSIREELMFKFPAKAGEQWVTLENTISYDGLRTVETPAGRFECHMYSVSQYGETYSHSCISEGVGVIYSDTLLQDGSLETAHLISTGTE